MKFRYKQMLMELDKFENNSFENNVKQRLDRVLELYLAELKLNYESLLNKTSSKSLYKEIIKKWK